MNSVDSAGVRIPPPFIYLAGLLIGIYGGQSFARRFAETWLTGIGFVFFLAGLALAFSAIMRFRVRGTDVNPNRPVKTLVLDGPYRVTRNPMYVGLALVYSAIALWTASLWALVMLVPVLLLIRYAVIAREERYLTNKFGDAYLASRASLSPSR
jgi:protein-S-isoprenylcysteine O-methyltransferase Ste14